MYEIVENLRLELLLNNQPSSYSNAIQSLVDNNFSYANLDNVDFSGKDLSKFVDCILFSDKILK